MKRKIAAFALALLAAVPAFADTHRKPRALNEGEIRKVDKEAKKITIKHGPLPALEMPAMTMAFQVKDPAMLDKVKAGDKVKFEAQKLGDAYTVTQIEKAN